MRTIQYATLLGCLSIMAVPAAAQDSIGWLTDWRAARGRAQSENRLVLLHFWSDTCPPCKQLDRNVFTRGDVARAITSVYVPVKINVDESPQLSQFYQIQSVPYDIIVDPSGKVLQRQESPQDPNQYIALLDTAKAQYYAGFAVPRVAQNRTSPERQPPSLPTESTPNNNFAGPPGGGMNNRGSTFQGNSFAPANSTSPTGSNSLLGSNSSQPAEVAAQYANPYGGPSNTPSTNEQPRVQWNQHMNNSSPAPGAARSGYNPQPSGLSQQAGSQFSPSSPAAGVPPWQSQPSARPGLNLQPQTGHPRMGGSRRLGQATPQSPTTASRPAVPTGSQFALEGFCPVALVEQSAWVQGDPRFGRQHRGRIYLFTTEANMMRFHSDPERYSPVLSGYDAVRYSESGQLVDGKREHGLYYGNQYFLFADEAVLERFRLNPNRYMAVVQQAMRQTADPRLRR